MDEYVFTQSNPGEFERLALLARYVDPVSCAVLDQLNIAAPQRWAEIGIGAGSIANYLARRLSGGGSVTAYDVTFENYRSPKPPNLTLEQVDLNSYTFESSYYDGLHCRFILLHLRDRLNALRGFIGSLRPGGILIATESDCSTWTIPAMFPALRKTRDAYLELGRDAGWSLSLGADLPQLLHEIGLSSVTATTFRTTSYGPSLATELVAQIFTTLASEPNTASNFDHETLASAIREMHHPALCMTYVETTICQGRR